MPLLVPVHGPSRIVNAALGDFFGTGKECLVVATLLSLQFYDENFNLHTLSVSVGAPISSIGSIRTTDRDAVVLCLSNGLVYILVCQGNDGSMEFSKQQVFESTTTDQPLEYLCQNDSKSIALFKGDPSHLFVLRGGKQVKATVHRGRWGKVMDAGFVGPDTFCMLQNDPATSPMLEIYTIKSTGSPVLDSKHPLLDLDVYNQLRLCPVTDGVLVYDFENLVRYSFDGDSFPVRSMCALSVTPDGSGGAIVAEKGGAMARYNPLDNRLEELESIDTAPVRMLISNSLAFSWGNGQPVQIIELGPTLHSVRSLPALGPVQEIIPYFESRPARLMALTSSIFDYENYDKCFSTLSRIEFGQQVTHLASLSLDGETFTRIFHADPSVIVLSSPSGTLFYESNDEGLSQLSSYEHYDPYHETITGSPHVQVTPKGLKTSTKVLKCPISFAAVASEKIYTAHLDELTILDQDLVVLEKLKTDQAITLVKNVGAVVWATPSELVIETPSRSVATNDTTDVTFFKGHYIVGTNRGEIHVLKNDSVEYTITALEGPISFALLGESLVASSNGKAIRLYKDPKNKYTRFSYDMIGFNQQICLLEGLSPEILLTTRPGKLDIWLLGAEGTTSVTTVGTQEAVYAMTRAGNNLITFSRDDRVFKKCHLIEWPEDLGLSKILRTLIAPDEQIDATIVVEFTGFKGYLVALNHVMKSECKLQLFDVEDMAKEPQTINLGVGAVVKMQLKESSDPETAQVYLLNSDFMGLVTIDKSGIDFAVYDIEIKSGGSFDVYGEDLVLFDFFDKAKLCKVSGKTCKHRLWLDETQETTSGLILPPTEKFPETSYLVATLSNELFQFEVNANEELVEKSMEVQDKVSCMSRVSYPSKAPFIADAIFGTANGGLNGYFRLPSDAEKSLALLASRARSLQSLSFNASNLDSCLIYWPDIDSLPPDQQSKLCSDLGIDESLIEQVRESIRAFLF